MRARICRSNTQPASVRTSGVKTSSRVGSRFSAVEGYAFGDGLVPCGRQRQNAMVIADQSYGFVGNLLGEVLAFGLPNQMR